MRSFGSDNHAPVHPAVLEAVVSANTGDAPSYGHDPWTERALELLKLHFGPDSEPFLVFNGTGANVLALDALLRPYQSVVCGETAHIHTDECGAPERHLGVKLLPVPTVDGRCSVAAAARAGWGTGDEHRVQPGVLSITQSTELGTVYPLEDVAALADWAHGQGMAVHLDGARLANAAAALGVGLGEATTACGVDVVTFGVTKNGGMGAEAVVFCRGGLAADFLFLRKQGMQLASKMRYAAAQVVALLTDDLWHQNAAHANAMAARLAAGVASVPGIRITRPVEVNAVFAVPPPEVVPPLQAEFPFYVWDEAAGEVRWMTSFATTESDVDAFVTALRRLTAAAGRPAKGHLPAS